MKKECRSQMLGHSASLAKSSPPLSHRGDAQRGTVRCASARFVVVAEGGDPKLERVVSRSLDQLAIEDLEMFWLTASPRSESQDRSIALTVPERDVTERPHSASSCRRAATARHNRCGLLVRQRLPAASQMQCCLVRATRSRRLLDDFRPVVLSLPDSLLRRSVVVSVRGSLVRTAPVTRR